jgi:outer membrane protein assembly factor BamB
MHRDKSHLPSVFEAFPLCLVLLLVFAAFSPACHGNDPALLDWNQWRGPRRDGKISAPPWPERLGDNLKQLWVVPLGPSYSGPVVVGDRVFVTETADEKMEIVRALDRESGKEIWKYDWEGAIKVPFFARSNGSWIRSTPAYADGRLFVAGIRDLLVCLDAQTGKELWRVDFVEKLGTPVPAFGFVCSPLVVGKFVYVQAGAGLHKLHVETGEIVWKSLKDEGGMGGSAFSSPYMTVLQDKNQLLVQTRTTLAGVDPETGEELWSLEIPAFQGMNILTPTLYKDRIFTSSYGGTSLLLQLTDGADGTKQLEEVWNKKLQGYMSSPVIIDGYIYLHLRNERFACLDAETGEEKWTTEPYGKYWSLVANGDRILALDQTGELFLIRATPEKFDLIDRKKISESETWAHLAVRGDEIFIRELNAMTVFRWEK